MLYYKCHKETRKIWKKITLLFMQKTSTKTFGKTTAKFVKLVQTVPTLKLNLYLKRWKENSMEYVEIRKLLEENELDCSISLEVASCVCATLTSLPNKKIRNDSFAKICECVRKVWNNIKHPCTQTIADIVVDNIYNCYEYWNRKPMKLCDLCDNIDAILDQYYAHLD